MSSRTFVFVGCLNRGTPYFEAARGQGIAVLRFDPETGAAALAGEVPGVDNPSWLTVDSKHARLYANSEVFGWNEGIVTAYAFDPATARLTYLNKQPTLGSICGHASLDRSGRHLLVGNYAMGEPDDLPGQAAVVLPLRADGGLGPALSSISHAGLPTGPNAKRQERPHVHSVVASPDNRFLLVADLGIDRVMTYRFDAAEGRIEPKAVHALALAPGAGPRHLVFHPNGRLVFVVNELDSTVVSLAYRPEDGSLSTIATASTLPPGAGVANDAAEIQLTPDGRFLYASNRGHDSLAIYAVDAETGAIEPRGHAASGGRTPRNFAIDPGGRFLLAVNQNGDNLVTFRIDPASGALTRAGEPLAIGTPMCVRFGQFAAS
jgi:6-phosphogluconolactonase